ncbi:MAG: hypothetical protein JW820_18135, partial [Spirochaetales bacterium]|nr:hypothetical protein [Spirochaetales bacterium]
TRVFEQFKREGRLLTQDWTYYDHSTTVFQPRNMSPFELQAGRLWVLREFTRAAAVLERLPANMDHPLYHLVTNLGFHMGCRKEIRDLPVLAARLFGDPAEPAGWQPSGAWQPSGGDFESTGVPGQEERPARGLGRFPLWNLRLSDLFSAGAIKEGV